MTAFGTKPDKSGLPDRGAEAALLDVSAIELHPHERGPAKYFHGRESERAAFRDLCHRAAGQGESWHEQGSTFIIQGPPGVGKTALLVELWKEAQQMEWNRVRINPDMLCSPHILAEKLGLKYVTQVTKGVGGSATIVSGERTWQIDARQSVLKLLEVAGKRKRGILLVLDEAQQIARMQGNPEVENALDAMHNGRVGSPVILLAGGLAHTSQAFADLGISRVFKKYRINLGRLSADAERAVIRDWLVKAGGAPESEVEPWVDAIAAHTDGWPEHIVSFAEPASQILQQTGGRLTDAGLERVLAEGETGKAVYYNDRCEGLAPEDVVLLGAVVATDERNGAWSLEALARAFRMRDRTDAQPAAAAVDEAIRKGVLSARAGGVYHIPIPSMQDYLKGRFEAFKSRHPELAPRVEAAARESLSSSWAPGLGRPRGDESETPGLG